MEYIDEQGCSWDSYRDYILGGLLGICGCNDEELTNDIITVLLAFDKKAGEAPYYTELLPKNSRKYVELILHNLDHAGLLEHGTSVRGSWTTEKGQEVIKKLKGSL